MTTTQPERSEAQIALWRELVSVATSFRPAAVLFAAAELDLFTRIPPDGCDAVECARRINVTDPGARVLLNALAAIGLLVKTGERYTVPEDLRALLTVGPSCIVPEILAYQQENAMWLQLPALLRDPDVRPDGADVLAGEQMSSYLTAVALTNQPSLTRLIDRLDPHLHAGAKVLDLGGGSGSFTIGLLAANPSVTATLLDRRGVIEEGRARLAEWIEAGRLVLIEGDALSFASPPIYDMIVISDLLHYFPHDDKRRVIENAVAALTPHGALVISKFALPDAQTPSPFAALFSLRLHAQQPGAYLESDEELAEILADAGLRDLTTEPLDEVKTLLMARKTA